MRKVICMVLAAALLLSGCASGAGEETTASAPAAQQPTTAETVTSVPTTEAPVFLDSAEFEIQRVDNSLRNANGDVLIEMYYDQVVLQGDASEFAAINSLIEADRDRYLASNDGGFFGTAEETEEVMKSMGMDYGDLFSTASAEVTHNAKGLLSIRISTGWFMGGVFNADHYGLTYDLSTGGAATLESLSALSPTEFEQQLKDIAAHWLRDTYGEGLFSPPEEVLAGYGLNDLPFYIENGEIILTFPTYTFTAGAAGSSVIPTGIMVE